MLMAPNQLQLEYTTLMRYVEICRIWNFDLKGNQMKKFYSKHNCTYFSNLFTILDTVFLDTDYRYIYFYSNKKT